MRTAKEVLAHRYTAAMCANGAEDAQTELDRLYKDTTPEERSIPAVIIRIRAYRAIIAKYTKPAVVEPIAAELPAARFEVGQLVVSREMPEAAPRAIISREYQSLAGIYYYKVKGGLFEYSEGSLLPAPKFAKGQTVIVWGMTVPTVISAIVSVAANKEAMYHTKGSGGRYAESSIKAVEPDPAEPTIATEDPEPIEAAMAEWEKKQLRPFEFSIINRSFDHGPIKAKPFSIFPGLPEHLNSALPEAIIAVQAQRQILEAERGIKEAQAKLNSRRIQAISVGAQAKPHIKKALLAMGMAIQDMNNAVAELKKRAVLSDAEYLGALVRAGLPLPEDWSLYIVRLRSAGAIDTDGHFTNPLVKSAFMAKFS